MTACILQGHNSLAIVTKGNKGQSHCLHIHKLSHLVQLNCRQGSDPSHCPCSNETQKKVATVGNLYSHQLRTNLSSLPAFYSIHKWQKFSSTSLQHPSEPIHSLWRCRHNAGTLNNTALFYKNFITYRPVSSSLVHATSHRCVSIQKTAKFN
jgi:hypothetical protein